jgi:hypothetical protein
MKTIIRERKQIKLGQTVVGTTFRMTHSNPELIYIKTDKTSFPSDRTSDQIVVVRLKDGRCVDMNREQEILPVEAIDIDDGAIVFADVSHF